MREDLRSSLLLGSAEAVNDWVEEVISWLASERVRFFKDLVVSGVWGFCRDGRPAGRDWEWGSGGSSSSGCHVCLPGKLGRLRQLSMSSLWQQSKLWLGRRLPVLVAPVLRLSSISLNRSSSSPDPRKLLSRPSSAQESWVASGLRGGVLCEVRQPQISAPNPQLQSGGSGRFEMWGSSSPLVLASH